MKKQTKPIQTEDYEAEIKVLGKKYKSKGKTAREAILNLKPTGKCAGVSVLSVLKGKNRAERILTSAQTFRLFSLSPLTREIAIKNVSLMFNL